jgi:ribosomal protein L24E
MCKAFHGRSGLHPMMLPQGLKCLARQMIVANGGVILRISGSIETYIAERDLEPKRYVWTAQGEEILKKIKRAKDSLQLAEKAKKL